MWQLLAGISALFSASAAIFEKKALLKNNALNFTLILALFNLILSLPFFIDFDFQNINQVTLFVLYGKSILGSVAFLFVMSGLKRLEISSSLPLLVLTPAIVAIFAFIFLQERLSLIEVGGMFLLMSGTYILQLRDKESLLNPFKGVKKNKAYFYILGAILIFTITSILDKTLLGKYRLKPEIFLPLQHIFFLFNFMIIWILKKESKKELKTTFIKSWKTILIVSVFTIIYRYSHILAIKGGSVALVLSIKRTSVFFATVIGGTYFKESSLLRKGIATIIMIAGCIIVVLN